MDQICSNDGYQICWSPQRVMHLAGCASMECNHPIKERNATNNSISHHQKTTETNMIQIPQQLHC